MVNLLVLLLITYHLRGIVTALHEQGFVLQHEARALWESGYFWDFQNYYTFFATLSLTGFPAAAYIIELLAGKGMPKLLVSDIITKANKIYAGKPFDCKLSYLDAHLPCVDDPVDRVFSFERDLSDDVHGGTFPEALVLPPCHERQQGPDEAN